MCKMIISTGLFIHFFKIFIFQVVSGGKRTKNCPKWQKILSVTLYISQTIHYMIIICGMQVWNDNIFKRFSHFFKTLIFKLLGGPKGKKWPKTTKKLFVLPYISGTISCLQVFLHLFQIFIFGVNSGVKEQKLAQNDKKLSVVFHISGSIHHMIVIFGTHV